MKNFIIILIFVTASACDTPQRNRYIETPAFDSSTLNDNEGEQKTLTNDSSSNQTTVDSSKQQSQNYEHCTRQYNQYLNGPFYLCNNSVNEVNFRFKFQNGCSSDYCRVVFVPMHILSDGSSFMVGRGEYVHPLQAEVEYEGNFTKLRQERVNGVMVVKQTSLNAFTQCMTAEISFLQQCYQQYGQYNQNCQIQAKNYASQQCNIFVQNHSGSYVQIRY